MKNIINKEKKKDYKLLGMSLVIRNLKSFGRMEIKKDRKKDGMNPVERTMYIITRMEVRME